MRLALSLVLALLVPASLVAAVSQQSAPAVPRDVYGTCEGVGSQEAGEDPVFECVDYDCDPGCAKMDVSTAHGPGKICVCDYIGPQPFCCSLAFVEGAGGFTTYGDCNSPGCNTSGTCLQIVIPATPDTPAVTFVNCDS